MAATSAPPPSAVPAPPFEVVIREGMPGVCYWNLVWSRIPGGIAPVPMRGGSFPSSHPVMRVGGNDAMDRFRGLGYWASCFPEGDGITFKPEAQARTLAEVSDHVELAFGWKVRR